MASEDVQDVATAGDDAGVGEASQDGRAAGGAAGGSRSRRSWARLGIQSKLLAMLLGVSILAAFVAGFLGYRFGSDALRDSAFDRLTNVRESRAREITALFENLQDGQLVYTRGTTAADAVEAFTKGFHDLADSELTQKQDAAVDAYYTDVLIPRLEENSGLDISPEGFIPTSPAERYLHAYYTDPNDDFGASIEVDDAGDGSAWSQAHAEFHDYFRQIAVGLEYDDVLLLDTEGNVVYSAFKAFDLGTNVHTGPLQGTILEQAYESALGSNSVDFVQLTDFERYPKELGPPSAWAVSPIGDDGDIVGALALQIPIGTINDVMTGGGDWQDEGLGESGEIYLVGHDMLMRSTSRFILEDPERYRQDVIDAGTTPEDADRMVHIGGTILIQEVDSEASRLAHRGRSGTLIAPEYRGKEALVAYAPLDLPDVDWALIAKIGTDEAFAPVRDFTRQVVLWTAGVILLISALSMVLAQVFVKPVRELLSGVRNIAGGDLDGRVNVKSHDEFGDLGKAFNDMGSSLQIKAELAEDQQRENERMLLTMMPEAVAERYREGEETIASDHNNVSVLYADVVGFDEFVAGTESQEALGLWNQLLAGFDDVVEQHGAERVRTLRRSYLASCGLVTPRVDHLSRTVDCAQAMKEVIDRFNSQHDAKLSFGAGIDSGTVSSGLIGRNSVMYDLWGEAVNLAYRVQGVSGRPGIFVSARVHDRLADSTYEFEKAGELQSGNGAQAIWRLLSES